MKYIFNILLLLCAGAFLMSKASADERDNQLVRQARQLALCMQGLSYGELSPSLVLTSLAARVEHLRPFQSEMQRLRLENDALKNQMARITSIATVPPVRALASSSSSSGLLLSVTPSDAVSLSQSVVFESIPVHINRIITQANQHIALKEFPAALRLLENALLVSGLSEQDRAQVLTLLGDIYFNSGHTTQSDYQSALEYYDRALRLKASSKIRSSALARMGIIYFNQHGAGNNGYDEALKCFNLIPATYELSKRDQAEILIRKAVIYQHGCATNASNYAHALVCSYEALRLGELRNRDKGVIFARMGDMYYKGDATSPISYERALRSYTEALKCEDIPVAIKVQVEQAIEVCKGLLRYHRPAQLHTASTSSSSSSSSAYHQPEDSDVQIISLQDAPDQLTRTSVKRTERAAVSSVAQEDQSKRPRVGWQQPYCEVCKKSFSTKKNLRKHMETQQHARNDELARLRASTAQSATQELSETDTDEEIPELGSEE